ncbi:hypothetical protein M0805_003190 [Coniferiporia weirii]|nr:hypothetical protein M0805_003190 [Coniferiporia weirii]
MAILEEGLFAEPMHITASPGDTYLQCTAPSRRLRYDRNIEIKSFVESEEWVFGPLGTFTVKKEKNVPSWEPHTHPEGQANLEDSKIREEIEDMIGEIERKAAMFNKPSPTEVEVLLEHTNEEGWLYYMMDLGEHRIFWFDEFDASQLIPEAFGIEKFDHLCHLLEYEYWMHIEHFPCHRNIEKGVLEELSGILNYTNIG